MMRMECRVYEYATRPGYDFLLDRFGLGHGWLSSIICVWWCYMAEWCLLAHGWRAADEMIMPFQAWGWNLGTPDVITNDLFEPPFSWGIP